MQKIFIFPFSTWMVIFFIFIFPSSCYCCCFHAANLPPHEWHTIALFVRAHPMLTDINDHKRAFHTTVSQFTLLLFRHAFHQFIHLTGVETVNKFPLSIHFTTIDLFWREQARERAREKTTLYCTLLYTIIWNIFLHVLWMLLLFWTIFVNEEKAQRAISYVFFHFSNVICIRAGEQLN